MIATIERVLRDDEIDRIADAIIDLQNREDTTLPALRQQLKDCEQGIENMLNAIQMGILTPSTKTRLEELESQRESLKASILQAELEKPKYTKEQIVSWINRFKYGNVDDIEYRELYGREIPDGSWSGEIQMNDAVCQLYYGKGIFGKLFYGVLRILLKISEWQGKPNLNVLFNYNMPIRGYAKMTGGFVTMEMARALTEMANGHRIKGTAHLIKAAVKRD